MPTFKYSVHQKRREKIFIEFIGLENCFCDKNFELSFSYGFRILK